MHSLGILNKISNEPLAALAAQAIASSFATIKQFLIILQLHSSFHKFIIIMFYTNIIVKCCRGGCLCPHEIKIFLD